MTAVAWFRTIVGFLVAPIAPGVLAVVLATLAVGSVALSPRGLSGAAWIIGLSAVLGYPIAIAFGLPLYVFFRWRGWNGLLVYVLAGAFLGLVIYSVYFAGVLLNDDSANGLPAPQLIPAGMISGIVAAVSFWLVARPDRASV
jgi:hypothetical protein